MLQPRTKYLRKTLLKNFHFCVEDWELGYKFIILNFRNSLKS